MNNYEGDVNKREVITNTFSAELNFDKEILSSEKFMPSFDIRPSSSNFNELRIDVLHDDIKSNNKITISR